MLHRQQQNPRSPRTINWLEVFTINHCGGSVEERDRLLNRFNLLNNKATKKEANGMLSVFIDQGAKETLLREVWTNQTCFWKFLEPLSGTFMSPRGILITPRGEANA